MPRCLLLVFAVLTLTTVAPAADPPAPKVKLAVVVVFDQMRGDYVERWRPLFSRNGFVRLQDEGAWFVDCHYPHGITTTGPGHASILAGCSGNRHGIINNNWYDRATGKAVYCASTPRYEFVPAPMDEPTPDAKSPPKKKEAGNPDRFLSQTLADVLKESTNGRGKVFALSLKDRSAVLPAGRRPDGAYWFAGRFVTSTYYRDTVHPWVERFNTSPVGRADQYFGRQWTRHRPDLDYEKFIGPDDAPGEGRGAGQGKTFPHPTTGGKEKIGPEFYDALANSPFGNELLLNFAKTCITEEQLGQDDVPDLLTVSFSSNDLVGHAWGPDSQEVFDITLASDTLMASFLEFLDQKVGRGNYSLVVTADHGICPLPEFSAKQGKEAKRVSPTKLLLGVEKVLRDKYGTPPGGQEDQPQEDEKTDTKKDRVLWIESVSPPYVYLNHRLLKAKGVDPADAAETLAAWVRKQDDVFRAYSRKQLLGDAGGDEVLAMMQKSYHPDRGGDVVIVLKPYYLLGSSTTGTTHGTPHSYDTHTVFLVYGPGIAGGKRTEKITPLHAAAITARFLGVAPPKDCEYALPASLQKP